MQDAIKEGANMVQSHFGLIVLASWIGAVAPTSVAAQEVVEIVDDLACPSCLVETGPSVTLTGPDEGIWFSSPSGPRLARDSQGNYIMAPVEGDGLIAVFGPDGRYLSSYGRIGGGPGEFATDIPLLIEVGDGDVVYVIDPVNLHTLAPRAETSLDQVRMPVAALGEVAVLESGIAVEATVRTEDGMTTIQLLDADDGTIVHSIGPTESGGEPGAESGVRRALGRSNDGKDVWSAPVGRLRITRYGPDGEAKARIERTSGLFRSSSGLRPGAPFLAPVRPTVSGIVQDGDGLLWVAITRPPRTFSPLPGFADTPDPGVEALIPSGLDLNRFLHTTIEVLDPAAGAVIARRDFDEYVRFVRTRGDDVLVYSLRAGELGFFDCVVTPLTLLRR